MLNGARMICGVDGHDGQGCSGESVLFLSDSVVVFLRGTALWVNCVFIAWNRVVRCRVQTSYSLG